MLESLDHCQPYPVFPNLSEDGKHLLIKLNKIWINNVTFYFKFDISGQPLMSTLEPRAMPGAVVGNDCLNPTITYFEDKFYRLPCKMLS